jgi:hypothetical protein
MGSGRREFMYLLHTPGFKKMNNEKGGSVSNINIRNQNCFKNIPLS